MTITDEKHFDFELQKTLENVYDRSPPNDIWTTDTFKISECTVLQQLSDDKWAFVAHYQSQNGLVVHPPTWIGNIKDAVEILSDLENVQWACDEDFAIRASERVAVANAWALSAGSR